VKGEEVLWLEARARKSSGVERESSVPSRKRAQEAQRL